MENSKDIVAESIRQLIIVVFIYAIVLIGQKAAQPDVDLFALLKSACIGFVIIIPALFLKNFVKRPNLPGFAWATLLAFFMTLPVSPAQAFVVENVGRLSFMAHVTPLLAFAGLSVADKLPVLKQLSWKLMIVAIIVLCSTYFGSALISQFVLSSQGII